MKVLKSVFDDSQTRPDDGYVVFDKRKDGRIIGFVVFGRTPLTKSVWDIYWMAVDKNYQGQGVGRDLIKDMQSYILEQMPEAILRVETSTRKEYAHAFNLYTKQDFTEVGRIPDYYARDDHLIILSKKIHSIRCHGLARG